MHIFQKKNVIFPRCRQWDVAKMYHTTADSIKASNPECADGLSESAVIPRKTKLLLVKA